MLIKLFAPSIEEVSPQHRNGMFAVLVNYIFRLRKSGWSFMAIMNRASALPNEQCMPKSQNTHSRRFYTIAC